MDLFYVEAQDGTLRANIRIYSPTRIQSVLPSLSVGSRNHDSLCDVVASD